MMRTKEEIEAKIEELTTKYNNNLEVLNITDHKETIWNYHYAEADRALKDKNVLLWVLKKDSRFE